MYTTTLALLISLAAAAYVSPPPPPSAIPIVYKYGGYPRTEADIRWGTKPQPYIPTIFDTGSIGFWVYGPNATINDGSPYHFTEGPCNKSVKNFYNWPASSTHSKVLHLAQPHVYSYGGNGKFVSAYDVVNDTFAFTNPSWPALKNQRVALANFTVVAQSDDGCTIAESTFDHSILGLAPFGVGGSAVATVGPSFLKDLRDQGQIASTSFSMWFDKPSTNAKGQYNGTAIFGAVPSNKKYSGELVRMNLDPPENAYIGYYVKIPKLSARRATDPKSASKQIGLADKSVTQCLLDSGTGNDNLPFSQEQVINATGIINYTSEGGTQFLAWNGTCGSIPASATLNFTFAGATAGKKVTVAVPIRSYARGQYDELLQIIDPNAKVCGLSLNLDNYGSCTFGAPFFAAVFAAFNPEKNQVALAQGGVSTGSADGPSALGPYTAILPGKDVPGSV